VACLRVDEVPVRIHPTLGLASAAMGRVQRLHARFQRAPRGDAATTTHLSTPKVKELTS
jgi:hypothetical protein